MGDAKIVDIQPRTNERGTEYRFVFTISCTFFYYYDLVTQLSPDIQIIYAKKSRGDIEIDVKAGQEIGRIGGQTLDFAVWDTTRPLKNFVNPSSYQGEPWKIFTNDPLDYYTDEIKALALTKYARFDEPRSGTIDHDIEGSLIGNWFKEGRPSHTLPQHALTEVRRKILPPHLGVRRKRIFVKYRIDFLRVLWYSFWRLTGGETL